MKTENTDAPSPLTLVRQQLILAQVRIMELEDIRDELAPQLKETQQRLHQAQAIADGKIDELTHLARVHESLESQHRHLSHVQHLTHEALSSVRVELEAAKTTAADSDRELSQLRASYHALEGSMNQVSEDLVHVTTHLDERGKRIVQLDREVTQMKASRSWRWTKFIRAIERLLKRRQAS